METTSRLVKPNEIGPKKRFGQHFLRDTGVLDRIVKLIGPQPGELLVEIGAGDGALSARLAAKGNRLLGIELDRDCVPALENALAPFPRATVIQGDCLRMDLPRLLIAHSGSGRLRFVGNLPYNIATAIIERLLQLELPVADMVFMVQCEVAERITASPGSRQYGFLSVFCQHLAEVRKEFKVSAACFVPRPKVVSAIVSLRPKSTMRDPTVEQAFLAITKAAFGHRRKMLANSMRQHPAVGKFSDELLARAGIDGKRRAEDLSVEEYEHLAVLSCTRQTINR